MPDTPKPLHACPHCGMAFEVRLIVEGGGGMVDARLVKAREECSVCYHPGRRVRHLTWQEDMGVVSVDFDPMPEPEEVPRAKLGLSPDMDLDPAEAKAALLEDVDIISRLGNTLCDVKEELANCKRTRNDALEDRITLRQRIAELEAESTELAAVKRGIAGVVKLCALADKAFSKVAAEKGKLVTVPVMAVRDQLGLPVVEGAGSESGVTAVVDFADGPSSTVLAIHGEGGKLESLETIAGPGLAESADDPITLANILVEGSEPAADALGWAQAEISCPNPDCDHVGRHVFHAGTRELECPECHHVNPAPDVEGLLEEDPDD